MQQTPATVLRDALYEAGMNARQLAAATGVSEGRLSEYLNGRRDPGTAQLIRLLTATGHRVQVTQALDGNGAILAELLDLGDALSGRAPVRRRPRPLPPRFLDLIRHD